MSVPIDLEPEIIEDKLSNFKALVTEALCNNEIACHFPNMTLEEVK